jgi:hypothetical protein
MTILIIAVIHSRLLVFDSRIDCQKYLTDMQISATCTAVPIRLEDGTLE